ncbi:MAG: Gfo/Idh/MocA family oxidoreductase [Spirochaetales bacterium]|nr:Gfo/Idh/MocA family oxidoreductase [Spirochaetales bacterium]MCF7939123.1 Gfo/Idh/MocA family oxidoreductase [Spirochaetales bacterium]
MGNNTVRCGLIGAGRAGLIHARNFAGSVARGELAGVADPSREALEQAKSELGDIQTFTDYREMLKRDDIDAVIVVTPTVFHRDVVLSAAAEGKHVLCEKPMAMNVKESKEMIDACDAASVKLQIGFMRRFDAGFRHAKEQIESGAIGDVVMIKSLTHGPSKPQPWMLDIAKSNGPLAEVSSHDIDTLRWYSGSDISEVYAVAGNYRSQFAAAEYPDFYDNVLVVNRFADGKQGLIEGAVYVKYGYDSRVEILGTEGVIFVGTLKDKPVEVVSQKHGSTQSVVQSWQTLFIDAYRAEDQSFVQAILEDSEPEVTGIDGMRAVQVVNAGNKSITSKQPVSIDLS